MKFHLDALTLRWASPKFQAMTNHVRLERVNPAYVWELAVLLETPGIRPVDLRNWFDRKLQIRTIRHVQALGLDVADLARENALSVTPRDARMMCVLTPPRSSPSAWGRAWIVERGVEAAAKDLGVDVKVVHGWLNRLGRKAILA